MTYIILCAGAGTRLHPITLQHPKTLFSLDGSTTVLRRMVTLLQELDDEAKIVGVAGFQSQTVKTHVSGVIWVDNPFYAVTNSIASLWLAKEHLQGEVTIINGDIIMSRPLMEEVVIRHTDKPYVLMDSSIQKDGDYNVQADHGKVVVMSKELTNYSGEYAGVTKLDPVSAKRVTCKIDEMLSHGMYTTWYESALVQMIFEDNFELFAKDISKYSWTEIDNVDDLVFARNIHLKENQ